MDTSGQHTGSEWQFRPASDQPGRREPRRVILSEDLPLTLLTAVAAAVVVTALGLDRQFALIGVVVAPLAADLVKNAVVSRGWGKRRIVGLTALLAFLGSARDALAGSRSRATRARPPRPRPLRGVVATAALSSALAVALVTSLELAHGSALAADRSTTFFSTQRTAAAVSVLPRVDPGPIAPETNPEVTDPGAPGPEDAGGTDPVATGPADSGVTDPAGPGVTDPGVTDPGATDPEGARPGATDPGAADSEIVKRTVRSGDVTLVLPTAVELEAEGPRGARLRFDVDAVDGRGGHASVTCDPPEGAFVPIGMTTVRCRTAGQAGDVASGSFKAVVQDTTGPRLVIPPDLTATTDEAGKPVSFHAAAHDAVDGDVPVRCRPPSGSVFQRGKTAVTCTATDRAGNEQTGSFVVQIDPRDEIADTEPPVLELANLEREAVSGGGVRVEFAGVAKDAVEGDIAATCRPSSGSLFPLGETTVRCTARDAAGNTGSGTFVVTVVDTTPPTLRLPPDRALEATSRAGAAATYQASALDTVSGQLTPSCTPASGTVFALGSTLVKCAVADRAGNRREGSFRIVVVDTTPPSITTDGDQTVEAESERGAAATYKVSAVDLVDGSVKPRCSPPPGLFPLATTTVTCSAADAHDNRARATFRITVADRTGPVFDPLPDITAEAASSEGVHVKYRVRAVDAVSGTVRHSCSPASGTLFPIGTTTVTCSAVDERGNRSRAEFPVTVRDTTGPVLTLPADLTVDAVFHVQQESWGHVLDYEVTAVDSVDGSVAYRCKPPSGTFVQVKAGETEKVTVSCSASDARGNRSSGRFTITIHGPAVVD